MTFATLFGMGVSLSTSAVVQGIFRKYGKGDLSDTLNTLTHVGALSYAVYFLAKLMQVTVQTFL